jgi:hypothetical protein
MGGVARRGVVGDYAWRASQVALEAVIENGESTQAEAVAG